MNIKFANLDTRYKSGMDEFLKFHNINSSKDGFNITIEITDEEIIKILKESNEIKFTLNSYHQIFRAIFLAFCEINTKKELFLQGSYANIKLLNNAVFLTDKTYSARRSILWQ